MKFLAALLAFAVLVPSADAAIIRSTKQKKLPVIADAYVEDGLRGFGFDIVKAPTTDAYDVWGKIVDARGKTVNEWLIRSMRFRTRSAKQATAEFRGNLADMLAFAGKGPYDLTLFACASNVRKPTAKACASAETTIAAGAAKKAR